MIQRITILSLIASALLWLVTFSVPASPLAEADAPPLSRFHVIALSDSVYICRQEAAADSVHKAQGVCMRLPPGCYLLMPRDLGATTGGD